MDEKTRQRIRELIGYLRCEKGFVCAESGLAELCKARDCGLDNYLECCEERPADCQFALAFGLSHLCQCPVRVYLSKKIRR